MMLYLHIPGDPSGHSTTIGVHKIFRSIQTKLYSKANRSHLAFLSERVRCLKSWGLSTNTRVLVNVKSSDRLVQLMPCAKDSMVPVRKTQAKLIAKKVPTMST